jgi:hypothetical protein
MGCGKPSGPGVSAGFDGRHGVRRLTGSAIILVAIAHGQDGLAPAAGAGPGRDGSDHAGARAATGPVFRFLLRAGDQTARLGWCLVGTSSHPTGCRDRMEAAVCGGGSQIRAGLRSCGYGWEERTDPKVLYRLR